MERIHARESAVRAFEAALGRDPSREAQVRRAAAFWNRLGDADPEEIALDTFATPETLAGSLAEACEELAKDCGFVGEQITDALLYAAQDRVPMTPRSPRLLNTPVPAFSDCPPALSKSMLGLSLFCSRLLIPLFCSVLLNKTVKKTHPLIWRKKNRIIIQ